jgi:hypothetical protein
MSRTRNAARALSLVLISLILPFVLRGPALAGPVRISEILVNPEGTDNGKTFVELYGPAGTSLADYTIVGVDGGTGTIYLTADLSGFVIAAGGVFVIADAAGGVTSVPSADAVFESFDPQNGPDSIQLRLAGVIVDAIGYGEFSAAVFAGEGTPVGTPPSGASWARRFADVDTDDNAADFLLLTTPTPGTAPLSSGSPVPEPSSILLLGAGLLSLAARCRRPRAR